MHSRSSLSTTASARGRTTGHNHPRDPAPSLSPPPPPPNNTAMKRLPMGTNTNTNTNTNTKYDYYHQTATTTSMTPSPKLPPLSTPASAAAASSVSAPPQQQHNYNHVRPPPPPLATIPPRPRHPSIATSFRSSSNTSAGSNPGTGEAGGVSGEAGRGTGGGSKMGMGMDGDDALLDLVQLEELQVEAEHMKALGNRHMAAQEYTQAYHAYSAALQLSPVGPSSHVFLSNRAAALLSLQRYAAAAQDAQRALSLAPNFGPAYARLGQALYFRKDYAGAVHAYEHALRCERALHNEQPAAPHKPNPVTQTYLDKARAKYNRYQRHTNTNTNPKTDQNHHHKNSSHSITSVASSSNSISSTSNLPQPPQSPQSTVSPLSYHPSPPPPPPPFTPSSSSLSSQPPPPPQNQVVVVPEPPAAAEAADPDLAEALRIQHCANQCLYRKDYARAIQEYTAALFLIPDDAILSPNLHLGRAHALNGSRRHGAAVADAHAALHLQPHSPAAYSTLAKSLFYVHEYRQAIEAFTTCRALLPPGEDLGMFDRAYLQQAEQAMEEEDASLRLAGQVKSSSHPHSPRNKKNLTAALTTTTPSNTSGAGAGAGAGAGGAASIASVRSNSGMTYHTGGGSSSAASSTTHPSSIIPKLPPPRFVPREIALAQSSTVPWAIPAPPPHWPTQHSPLLSPTPFRCGPEDTVTFHTVALGVKVNRGSDGMVRVVYVQPETSSSTNTPTPTTPMMIQRSGAALVPGLVVREAAGVDLRRPITNLMWGDTIALLQMAPRPITWHVAQELSVVPPCIAEEIRKNNHPTHFCNSTNNNNNSQPLVETANAVAAQDDAHFGQQYSF